MTSSSKTSTSVGLGDLPVEVLKLILGSFCLHCCGAFDLPFAYFPNRGQGTYGRSWYSVDRQALHSLCLVSKRFRDIAQSVLYHEFALGDGDSYLSTSHDWRRRLVPFLRTVLLRPDLAAKVRILSLGRKHMSFTTEIERRNAVETAVNVLDIQCDAFLQPLHDQVASSYTYKPLLSEVFCLIIRCLPNLSHLNLLKGVFKSPVPSSTLRAAGIFSLPLRSLDISAKDLDHKKLDAILELASNTLETLNIRQCNLPSLHRLSCPLPSMKSLCFTTSILGGVDLGVFLAGCKELEKFQYESSKFVSRTEISSF
jgi:hypothetical protein